MTAPSSQQTKLLNLLRELFQLDQPDLDFGLYRIMHAKSCEIEQFLEHDLLDKIREKVGGNKEEKIAQAKAAYERERQNAIDYGGNPDAPKVQQALAEYKAAQESQDDDTELFDHLYKFFERYYEGGDFLSRRYYARETSEKAAPYSVPYDGSEVYLHWANKDQYYIKTTESFREFSVDLAQAKIGDVQLFTDNTPSKLHFTVVEAEEGAHNNVKAASDKDRYFILDANTPLEWHSDELTVRFHYCTDTDKTGQAGKWREARNAKNAQGVLDALAQQAQGTDTQALLAQHFHHALASEIPKGKSGDMQTLLAKYLNQYTAKNSLDYFIHKNLGAFLKRELDFYIKNELFRLDDLGNADAPNPQQLDKLLKKALTLRDVAHKLIEFLARTEEFQKKLWLKKKFVVDTQWLVTLDKVPTELYPQIEANDAQWAEWVNLGFVGEDANRHELLKPESKLVLDTQFFDSSFTAQLLASIGSLDEATDGVLVHSENFQALNLMQARYREQVKCIYIDPPYNTGSNDFMYKDSYQHSSWLSMLNDRLLCSRSLMTCDGVIYSSYGDKDATNRESGNYSRLLDSVFGEHCWVDQLVVVKSENGMGSREGFATNHEYIFCYKNGVVEQKQCFLGISPSEEYIASFDKNDAYGTFKIDGLLKKKGDGARREDSPNCFYPIFYNPETGECALNPAPGYKQILPKLPSGDDGRWTWSSDFAKDKLYKLHAGKKGTIYIKDYLLPGRNQKPKSVLRSPAYLTDTATNEIKDVFGYKAFPTPKPITLLQDIIENATAESSTVLDFFAGSGATGESVIRLNRKNDVHQKYILVEMGDYFDSVTKPRITKVIYSADWKNGKPNALETGISQLVKVIRLESYEDTINNLQVAEQSTQGKVIATNPVLREAYYLHYLLELETQGSPSLLNAAAFTDPTAYTLNIKKPGSDAQARRAVDLVETFNWLLGLRMSKLLAPQTFMASFVKEADAELPKDTHGRLALKGKLKAAAGGAWWFRAIQGIVKGTGASAREERVLVVWRKLTGNLEQDNLVLEAYLREELKFDVRKVENAAPFDVVYVNGSHALPVMPLCEVRQLEEAFHRLMWDVQDV